jgi:tetratricopeptide (TPR) repeat protein
MAKIYVSSTFSDLKECREAVYKALRALHHDVIAMEDYVASDQRPLDKCLADVTASDIYVGIFAYRYGFKPKKDNPEQKSITELEFRCAVSHGKPCLLFLHNENVGWPPAKQEKGKGLQRIKAFRKKLADDYTISFFDNSDDLARKVVTAVAAIPPKAEKPPPEEKQKIAIARLPQLLTRDLFGRAKELQLLEDAWANPATNVVTFVAWGGVGKTALVNHWVRRLAERNYDGAARVYAWSFYSQGTSDDRAATAEYFINDALRWFGDPDPTAGSPWDKGERLAQLIRAQQTLLVLDGLEPLQQPPNELGLVEGRLKEQSMQALLRELAAGQPGLCVISTRVPVSELEDYESAALRYDLEQLAPEAGAQLLRKLGVTGEDEELEQAAQEFSGHSLALTLLGGYLYEVFNGDVRRRHEIEALSADAQHGGHARRVMASYERWLGDGPELAVLRLLGLFDRPADAESIAALRAAPAIPGLTDALQNLSETKWRQTLAKLSRIKLLAEPGARAATSSGQSPVVEQTKARPNDEVDAHPLVREHFRQQLQRHHPEAWREANLRLYEHLCAATKELPGTVEEMAQLFAAVAHGCAAGIHQQAFEDVYRQRIRRGEEFLSTSKHGAFGAELAALAKFFETPWRHPVAGLAEAAQAFVLNAAGFCLRALGRLQDAAGPMQVALKAYISQEDWKSAARVANNLSEINLTIGDPLQALEFARRSVAMADRSGDKFWQIVPRTVLADALHQAGQAEEAKAAFRQAEEMQIKWEPKKPILHSVRGFRYCDLLLDQGKHKEVKERAAQTIEWAKQHLGPLGIALDNLSLGRAWLLQSRQAGADDYGQAAEFLQRAVDGLRQAGVMDYLPRGLLARAELRRVRGDYQRARTDLDEAQRLAERSQMGLHLADCHLEQARLCLATGEREEARAHWTKAKEMIEKMGYHRRDGEVAEIEAQLKADGG